MARRHTLSGRLFAGALGEDTTLTAPAPTIPDFATLMTSIAKLSEQQSTIQRRLEEDARNRRIALYIGAASALFAAVKLGIIAFPHLKARVTRT
jgi:hypothetical protein